MVGRRQSYTKKGRTELGTGRWRPHYGRGIWAGSWNTYFMSGDCYFFSLGGNSLRVKDLVLGWGLGKVSRYEYLLTWMRGWAH